MPLAPSDRELVVDELGREPTPAEEALFENLWSEHCAYRSSRPLLGAFDSEGEQVVVGPGDDAAVVALATADAPDAPDTVYITMGIESHNHPSYVDPYDGAATGVGGIVRDTLSMGAYPIALADCLYFGPFDREHSRYLFEGVVEGISDYANAIGVPTVAGSVAFHPGYEGNPLVNVACVGLLSADRLVTAGLERPGNRLVLLGNATGRDGLGGASFASEDLSEDAETEDRPAVQVGDPYTEKLLVEANETLLERGLVVSARDLGAAGLGGATSEMAAKGGLGARVDLDRVHQREPNMTALEILLAESQERMCYEVRPEDLAAVRAVAERYDLGCSAVGEVTEGNYVCTFEDETVVDVSAAFLADGAPTHDRPTTEPTPPERDLPSPPPDLTTAFEAVVASPSTASKEWVYRQYDHEVGARTAVGPGDDAAVLAIREAGASARPADGPRGHSHEPGVGLAFTAGADPNWTAAAPYDGARAVALENATNLATKGAIPLAAVDCLNGGNPENAAVYGGFAAVVNGLADMCRDLDVPVVGGNVSLYNDSSAGPVPPTPTVAMTGRTTGYEAPTASLTGDGQVLVVGDRTLADGKSNGPGLGGSEYLAQFGGADRFPAPPEDPAGVVDALARVANAEETLAVHDVSHGGLAVTLAEMVAPGAGASVALDRDALDRDALDRSAQDRYALDGVETAVERLFHEQAGRAVVETTDPAGVREAFAGVAPVVAVGTATADGTLELSLGTETLTYDHEEIATLRAVIPREID